MSALPEPQPSLRRWPLPFAGVVVLSMIAVGVGVWLGRGQWLAWHWGRQLATVPDDQAAALLARIAELDQDGIPLLVDAMGSHREAVASGARRVLAERQQRWENLPWCEAAPRLLVLAESLAARGEGLPPTARREARRIAAWILRWRPAQSTPERPRMVAACEAILKWPDGGPGEAAVGAMPPPFLEQPDTPVRPAPSMEDLARLPGGGLPVGVVPGRAAAGASGQDARSDTMGGTGTADRGQMPHSPGDARAGEPAMPRPNSPATLAKGGLAEASRLPRPGITPAERGPPAGPAIDPRELERAHTLDLMRRLRTSGGDATAQIRAELVRRGFSEVHLELARRLFDPDPRARLELARRLPGLQSVDAEPWLVWLCEDEDAEVRAAAMALLATTGDPALLRRIERMAETDGDARVRRQAERLRQQRGATMR